MKNYKPRQALVITGRRDNFEFWMIHVLERGGLDGLFPAELCRLCGISIRTAQLWCDPRKPTYNKAFADAFDYALTLSEAFWEGIGRMGALGVLANFKERSFQFMMERSFSKTKGHVTNALTSDEHFEATQKLGEESEDGDNIIELGKNGVPEDPSEAYRWLLND